MHDGSDAASRNGGETGGLRSPRAGVALWGLVAASLAACGPGGDGTDVPGDVAAEDARDAPAEDVRDDAVAVEDRAPWDVPEDAELCWTSMECNDDNACNGAESCDPDLHVCLPGTPLEDGANCTVPLPGRCRDALCLPYACGDRWFDAWRGEECDDGNSVPGDGCEPDCTTTCHDGDACREEPDDPCTLDRCEPLDPPALGRLCVHAPPPSTEVCDYRDTDCDGEVDEGMSRPASTPLRLTETAGASVEPSLAWNSSNFLLAWVEDLGSGGALWARGLTEAGAPRGAERRVDLAGRAHLPVALWTPAAWAVVWTDERRGAATADVRLALLDTAAVRIGGEQLVTSAAARVAGGPAAVWDGLGLAVAWADDRAGGGNSELWFRRTAADGTPDAAGELRITDAAGVSREPALAWTGTAFLLAWVDGRDAVASGEEQLRLVVLDAAGVPLGAEAPLTTEARQARQVALAGAGDAFVATWTDARDGADRVWARRVDGAGVPVGTEFPLTPAGTTALDAAPVWSGLEWAAAWTVAATSGEAAVAVGWFPPAFDPPGGTTTIPPAAGFTAAAPSLAWTGGGYGAAWVDDRDGNREIYVALVGCAP
jgi:cysteine-rich repeat protein